MHELPFETMKQTLREREVHVWRISLDSDFPSEIARDECLSPDERARAALFIAPLERRRFIVSRIVLRHVLAGYHGTTARALPLTREAGGRPYVEGADNLFFSLSHSADAALIAVSDVPVGVDVERVRRIARSAAIARRILHPDTVATLQTLPPSLHEAAFVDAWTQREAHVKAVGGGLFRTADVLPFEPEQPDDGTIRIAAARDDGAPWSIVRFLPYAGARAAVVAPGALRQLRLFDWQDHGSP